MDEVIRIEVKIIIPERQTKKEFLQVFLDRIAEDADSFFWQTHFDIVEGQRVSLEAVLGKEGFPFLDGSELLIFVFDLVNRSQAQKVCAFFRSLAVTCDIEINQFGGTRIYGELIDLEDLEENSPLE